MRYIHRMEAVRPCVYLAEASLAVTSEWHVCLYATRVWQLDACSTPEVPELTPEPLMYGEPGFANSESLGDQQ